MAKKLPTYIFVILSAAYFLIAGAGYNIIQYCCDSCAHSGIEEVAHISCDSLHKHQHATATPHDHDDDMACSNVGHNANGCHLLRVKVDIPSIQSTSQLTGNSIQNIDLLYVSEVLFAISGPESFRNTIPPPNSHILASGRELLALHAVLLI